MNTEVLNFVETMFGCPIVKIEIEYKKIDDIIRHAQQIMIVYAPTMQKDNPLLYDLMLKEGVLAYVKYIVGRIRAKYPRVESPCGDIKDGAELVSEGLYEIERWRERIEGRTK